MEQVVLSHFDPPFRAEHIGSLLRPARLLNVRSRFGRGEVDRDALIAAEDRAIKEALALQERVGLKLATDGEFRRRSYHSFFYCQLGDISIDTIAREPSANRQAGARAAQPVALVNSRVIWTKPINVQDLNSSKLIPALSQRLRTVLVSLCTSAAATPLLLASAYTDIEEFWDDVTAAFGKELNALADAGCRYVQIDETAFAKFGDPEVQYWLQARDDWNVLIDKYIVVTNRILANAPESLRIGMHLCRGNRGGRWHAEGGYDVVADRLFNTLDIKFYFLEYDSERAGTFSPLRLVPAIRASCLASFRRRPPRSKANTISNCGSKRRRAICLLIALPSARSAASPASRPGIRFRSPSRRKSFD
jgi:5-methyltetrahydropteroyltriglutamate--homocysteine methyltransferase